MITPAPIPRVVFVNRFYWPDETATAQLLTDLAEGLAARGRQVLVIASRERATDMARREKREGVEIVRVRSTRWGRRGIVGKAVDYFTFTRAARLALRGQVHGGDWLVAMTDPPALAAAAAACASRASANLVHWIQDIHPEIGLALSGSRLLAAASLPWRHRRDTAWQSADACVTLCRDMASTVCERGVSPDRIRVIANWAPCEGFLAPVPPDQNNLRREWGLDAKFVVAYSGNLGRVHALEPVLAAAAELRHETGIEFVLIGEGPQRPALETQAKALRLPNVRFLPAQPRMRLAESLSVGDVHLVALRDGCERYVFPSKLYGILAVARPVVYIGPRHCELAEAIQRHDAGCIASASQPLVLAAILRELRSVLPRRQAMAQAALRWSRESGGFKAALDAWEDLFATAAVSR